MSWIKKLLRPIRIVAPYVLRNSQTSAYPTERLVFKERYSGRHRFYFERCISCGICARVCPDASIELVEAKSEEFDKKYPSIDYTTCSFCGYYVEFCPKEALEFTDIVELAVKDRTKLVYSPERLSEVPDVKNLVPRLKRRTEAFLTDKEMKYRKVKDV
jgi:formate hydrogenlyase subunit 6/NADH:ubiquinone oxidoreductase subunit I